MATGGGVVAGALIGAGVGIAAGVSVVGATTAAVEAGAAIEGANLACGGDMCASEVQNASQAVQEALPATQGSLQAVEQTGEKIVSVIGRWDANKKLAESIGGNYLNISMEVWDRLSPAQQWERNKQWLQEAIIRGDVFRLSSKISEATPGSGFYKELDYLLNVAKYTIDRSGQYLIHPR